MIVKVVQGQVSEDHQVIKDDIIIFNVDFTGVSSDLWALEWNSETNQGEIEYQGHNPPNKMVTTEAEIDEALGIPLTTMLERYQTVADEEQAAEEKRLAELAEQFPPLPTWLENRLNEYPTIDRLIVALYDTEDKEAVEAERAAVKAKWPKDDSGPIE